jgi:hypothetical protein
VELIDATSYEFMASVPIPSQPRAESLTLDMDQSSLLVGSEGKKSKVYSMGVPGEPRPSKREPCKASPEQTPTPKASPKQTPRPSAPFTPKKPVENS